MKTIKDYSIIETEWLNSQILPLEDKNNRILKEIKSKLKPLALIVENAYDAGILDKELCLSFDNPKSRYFNSNII